MSEKEPLADSKPAAEQSGPSENDQVVERQGSAEIDQHNLTPSSEQSADTDERSTSDSEHDIQRQSATDETPPSASDDGQRLEADRDDHANKEPGSKAKEGGLKHNLALLILFVLVLGVCVLGVVGYFWTHQTIGSHQHSATSDRLERLSEEMSALKNQLDQQTEQLAKQQQRIQGSVSKAVSPLQNQVANFKSSARAQAEQVDILQQRVDAQQKRLQNLSTTSREDWLLAEAEYLLKLANQRVLLERTPNNAVALLEAADAIVQQVAAGMGDAELFAVRKSIAREIAALKLVPEVDKEGLYLQLQALAEQVEKLPRVPPSPFASGIADGGNTMDATEVDSKEEGWGSKAWREVKSLTGVLDDYIRFDSAETPENPLITSHAMQMAALNVRIAIEQGQVAMLKDDSLIFKKSLQKAAALIDEHYTNTVAAQKFRDSLVQLSERDVAYPLPDISNSLTLLHSYLRQLHKVQPAKEGQL